MYFPLQLYQTTVRYIKSSTNQLTDCLSRLGCQKDKIELPKLKIRAITRQLHAAADRLNQFHTETAQDGELALLKNTLFKLDGPTIYMTSQRKSNLTTPSLKKMTIEDGLLLKVTHIIIPQTLHKEMIQLLHTGHLRLENV